MADENQVPEPPGREVSVDWNRIVTALESIAAENTQMRLAFGDISQSLAQAHSQDMSSGAARIDRARSRVDASDPDAEQQAAASQQELERMRSETAQRELRGRQRMQELERKQQAFETASMEDKISRLEDLKLVTGRTPEDRKVAGIPLQDLQEAMSAKPADRSERQLNLMNRLNNSLEEAFTREFNEQAPNKAEKILDAIEESGLRQLRYGQLPLQDILRSAGTLSSRYFLGQQARMMEAEDRLRRQGLPLTEQAIAGEAGMGRFRRGVNTVAMPASSLMARGAPALGQALVLKDLFNAATGFTRDMTATGQITGEGFGAGVGARFDAFRLGLNPFDMITGEVAQAIVQGVRQEGFRGQIGDAMNEAVRGVVNDLGISPDSAIQLFAQAVRKTGEEIATARERFEGFDDAARSLSMSVQEYTQIYLSQVETLSAQGFGRGAPGFSQALIQATPRGYANSTLYTDLLSQQGAMIRARAGLTPWAVLQPEQGAQGIEEIIEQYRGIAVGAIGDPNASNAEIAQFLTTMDTPLKGRSAGEIESFLNRLAEGRGPSSQLEMQDISGQYDARFREIRGRRAITAEEILRNKPDTWKARFGIETGSQQYRQLMAIRERDPYGLGSHPDSDVLFNVRGEQEDIPLGALRDLRRQTLEKLRPMLSDKDIKRWESNLGNREFDVVKEIRDARTRQGGKSKSITTAGGIVISLAPGATKKMFQLHEEREGAFARAEALARDFRDRVNPF